MACANIQTLYGPKHCYIPVSFGYKIAKSLWFTSKNINHIEVD